MKPEEKKAWLQNAQDILAANLPPIPQYDEPELVAAQEEGFQAGFESGYSLRKFTALLALLGTELAIFLFSGLAARGIRLPRFIARALQASLAEILGASEYDALKAAVVALQAAHPELAALTTDELIAIRAYSGEFWSSPNAALRLKNASELTRLGRFFELMNSGLSKLPAYKGTVNRTIAMAVADAAERYTVGAAMGPQLPEFSNTWLGWSDSVLGDVITGEIYHPDPVPGAKVEARLTPTLAQATNWYSYMSGTRYGLQDGYSLAPVHSLFLSHSAEAHNCRTFSQWEFRDAPSHF